MFRVLMNQMMLLIFSFQKIKILDTQKREFEEYSSDRQMRLLVSFNWLKEIILSCKLKRVNKLLIAVDCMKYIKIQTKKLQKLYVMKRIRRSIQKMMDSKVMILLMEDFIFNLGNQVTYRCLRKLLNNLKRNNNFWMR